MFRYFIFICLLLLPTQVSARWIDDLVVMDNEAVGGVQFSHEQHLDALGKNCVLCHNRVFHIDRKKNQPTSMAEMEKGKSCGACHDGKRAFSVTENCSNCHPTREIYFKVEDGDAKFSHDLHTGMYGCGDCHPGIFTPDRTRNTPATMEQMAEGESCGACHDGDTAFSVEESCETCHDM